ncbi:hypothetical protein [Flavobacterium sp.]|uniref:hypothetical protein n=1 Tax=Flavobacterium sp. TaxID=239 RepID=UPI003C381C2A
MSIHYLEINFGACLSEVGGQERKRTDEAVSVSIATTMFDNFVGMQYNSTLSLRRPIRAIRVQINS